MKPEPHIKAQDRLSPAWLTAGLSLFLVAAASPLFMLKFLPDVHMVQETTSTLLIEDYAPITPLATQADERRDYPEIALAQNGAEVAEELGSLATLIDAQGDDRASLAASSVRRMVLDSVSIDLETGEAVDTIEHLRVPLQDCAAFSAGAAPWLVPDGPRINAALESLSPELPSARAVKIAGPGARSIATVHDGLLVEYCPDLQRIRAVEILPFEPAEEQSSASMIAELDVHSGGGLTSGFDRLRPAIAHGVGALRAMPVKALPKFSAEVSASVADIGKGLPSVEHAGSMPELVSAKAAVDHGVSTQDDKSDVPSLTGIGRVEVKTAASTINLKVVASPERAASLDVPSLLAMHGNAYGMSTDVVPEIDPAASGFVAVVAEAPVLALASFDVGLSAIPALEGAYQVAEAKLNLGRSGRWRTQLRLALVGHNPNGIDGIFGDGTRAAIASLQRAEALPETGYLDGKTLTLLKRKSQRQYAAWLDRRAKERAERQAEEIAAASAPQVVRAAPAARSAPGCARNPNGVIISNQSIRCDFTGLREGLGSLFGSSG